MGIDRRKILEGLWKNRLASDGSTTGFFVKKGVFSFNLIIKSTKDDTSFYLLNLLAISDTRFFSIPIRRRQSPARDTPRNRGMGRDAR